MQEEDNYFGYKPMKIEQGLQQHQCLELNQQNAESQCQRLQEYYGELQ